VKTGIPSVTPALFLSPLRFFCHPCESRGLNSLEIITFDKITDISLTLMKNQIEIDKYRIYKYYNSMNRKIIFLGLIIVFSILSVSIFLNLYYKPYTKKGSISPDILFLTQPAMTFTGKIDSVEKDAVWVSNDTLSQNDGAMMPAADPQNPAASPFPTPIKKTIRYKVIIGKNSLIEQSLTYVYYLFISPTPPVQKKISLQDLVVGETITVSTNIDLRTLAGNQFEAVSLQRPPIENILHGTIIDIKNNQLTVKSMMLAEEQYQIALTDKTEISRMNNQAEPEKLALSDLKKDMSIIVYTNQDINKNKSLTALRIEPEIIDEPPPSPATSSPLIVEP